METPDRTHPTRLRLAATALIVLGAMHGPDSAPAALAAADLADELKRNGYLEADLLNLLDT